jgi:hypothetical protein
MTFFTRFTAPLVRRINSLISRTEAAHPGMPEEAAMVYVGDVYALRELRERRHADGWGPCHYSCDSESCKRLP